MIARSRVSTLIASDEGACSEPDESMVKVMPVCESRVSDLGISLWSSAVARLGVSFSMAVIRKAGKEQQEYLEITFSDVMISSYQLGGSGGGDPIPMDSISFNFGKIEFKYKEQKSDGTLGGQVVGKWDLKQNKAA